MMVETAVDQNKLLRKMTMNHLKMERPNGMKKRVAIWNWESQIALGKLKARQIRVQGERQAARNKKFKKNNPWCYERAMKAESRLNLKFQLGEGKVINLPRKAWNPLISRMEKF